ncbi:MAG: hypothetical protein HW395_1108, partial [candidate division NC10 bacterium]|nr:hypothetical protein [candidate division NC10 bacterium]
AATGQAAVQMLHLMQRSEVRGVKITS